MSYDLYLKPSNDNFSFEDFRGFFEKRRHYQINSQQAWYENEETGAYFSFMFQESEPEEEEYYPIAFNLNFFRPSYFAREANIELKVLCDFFNVTVLDPQMYSIDSKEFDTDKFYSGWDYGNSCAYQAAMQQDIDIPTLASEQILKAWQWNYQKNELEEFINEDLFIPKILFLETKGQPITACVWPDAIPSILPKVDLLIIDRKELAPTSWFKKNPSIAFGKWEDLAPLIEKYSDKTKSISNYLNYQAVPKEIAKHIKALSPASLDELNIIGQTQVLDSDILIEIKAKKDE